MEAYFEDVSDIKIVKKRYKQLALLYHPDKNNGDDTTFKKNSK